MGRLLMEAFLKFTLGVLFTALLLFVPAGTIRYPNGLLFCALLFIPMLFAWILMAVKAPDLLRKRLQAKEGEKEQSIVIKVSGVMFLSGFILAGLNFRFEWLFLPKGFVLLGVVLFVISYALFGEVLRENAYLSRTVEVQENQKVVDTGLYGIVRHPMYAVTLVLFLSMPLVLNSFFTLLLFLIYPVLLAKRIENEEKVLKEGLEGYEEYMKKVPYRLVPKIW